MLRQIRTTDRLDPVQEDSPALEYDLWEVRVDEAPGADATPRSLVVAQVANTANQSHSGPGPRLQEGARGVLVLGTAMSDEWVHPEFGWVYYRWPSTGRRGRASCATGPRSDWLQRAPRERRWTRCCARPTRA